MNTKINNGAKMLVSAILATFVTALVAGGVSASTGTMNPASTAAPAAHSAPLQAGATADQSAHCLS